MISETMSNLRAKNAIKAAEDGKRLDGRGIDDFRPIKLETNLVSKAEGSATVSLGDSTVISGVKVGVGTPFSDRPAEGVLMTGMELSPVAHNTFEPGRPGPDAVELARVVDRGIREAGVIDTAKLCIEEGEAVWMVNVDMYAVNANGNYFDSGTLASMAALKTAKMPKYEDGLVNREKMKKSLPITRDVVSVTFARLGDVLVVDPTMDEEKAAQARLTVGIADGNIVSMQKGGNGGLTTDMVDEAFKRALKHSKKLLKHLK